MILNSDDLRVMTLEEYREGAFAVLEKTFKINIRKLSSQEIGEAIIHMRKCKLGMESSGIPQDQLDYVIYLSRICELGLKEENVKEG